MFKRIIISLVIILGLNSLGVKAVEDEEFSGQDYIGLFELYEDYPSLTGEEMDQAISKLKDYAKYDMPESAIVDLIGPASFRKESDRNVFLQYYSISETTSTILTLQFYLSVEKLMSESQSDETQEISIPQPGLVLMDVQEFSPDIFQPIVDNYRDFIILTQSQQPSYDQLLEILGPANNYRYDFVNNSYCYEWIYVTDEEELDYVGIEVDEESQIIRINIPETIYEKEESSEETTSELD